MLILLYVYHHNKDMISKTHRNSFQILIDNLLLIVLKIKFTIYCSIMGPNKEKVEGIISYEWDKVHKWLMVILKELFHTCIYFNEK